MKFSSNCITTHYSLTIVILNFGSPCLPLLIIILFNMSNNFIKLYYSTSDNYHTGYACMAPLHSTLKKKKSSMMYVLLII